jgi:alanine racemase
MTDPSIRSKVERPTWVEIDHAAIAANIGALRKNVAATARFMAVVKAEAYGHGAIGVARSALEAGAERLGVATPYEGRLLRRAGIEVPIQVLSPILAHQAEEVAADGLIPSVTSIETARALAGRGAKIHVKVNTGMNRSGIALAEAPGFLRALQAIKGLEVEGIFSHYAGADDPDRRGAYDQFERFEALLRELRGLGLRPPIAHIANSAAIIDMPETALDMVRAGIAMYGLYPSDDVSRLVRLRPALAWKTRVVEARRLARGEAVSYNGTWIAPEDGCWTALLPVGYADGLRRGLSNRGEVLVGGRRRTIAGRVCMDLTVVDCGDAEPAIGEEVVLIGHQGDEELTADAMAKLLGTNNYEVTTQITYRVPRFGKR